MRNKIILRMAAFMGLLILFHSTGIREAESQTSRLTLDDAIKMALEKNPDMRISRLEVLNAKAQVDEAIGNAYPSIDLSASLMHYYKLPVIFFPNLFATLTNSTYSILFDEGLLPRDESKFLPEGLMEMSLMLENNYEAKAELTQILFNFSVFRGIGASKVYEETTEEQLKAKATQTIFDVKKAFYGVLLTGEILEITKASLANAEENLSNAKAYYKQGMISEFDALQAEVQVENIRPTVVQMENTHKNAKDGLKMLLGIDPREEIEIEGELSYTDKKIPDGQATITQALKSNYDVKTLEMKKVLDDAMIDLYRAELWPSLVAFGNYSYAGQSNTFDFMNYSTGMVGLNLSMNIFNGFQTSNRIQQQQIALMQTEEQEKQLKDAIKMQIRAKILDLKKVKSNLEAQERNVSLAERAYEIATVRYREGTGSQLEIQNADIALRQARTNRLQMVYDYIIAESELQKLTGNVAPEYLRSLKEIK